MSLLKIKINFKSLKEMSYETADYTRWIETLCERNYGVREELERIFREKVEKRKRKRKAFKALNRKN